MRAHPPAPPPWGWPTVSIVAVCLIVLAFDTRRLEGVPDPLWRMVYLTAAAAAILWRVTRRAGYLELACFTLFAASFARATSFAIWQPERLAGMAINVLVCVFAALTLRAQLRWAER